MLTNSGALTKNEVRGTIESQTSTPPRTGFHPLYNGSLDCHVLLIGELVPSLQSPMPYFLAKTDPETYSVSQFQREKRTTWDGVTNAQAAAVIRSMQRGDRIFVYHSMGQSAVVGLAKVTSAPRQDAANSKSWVVDMEFLKLLDPPTTLAEVKSSGLFDDWSLVRQSRLSTMAAPESFVEWMRARYPKAGL